MAKKRDGGDRPAERKRKKRRLNLIPFFTALLILFAVGGVAALLQAYSTAERADGYGAAGRIVEEPEYFTTMRPVATANPSLGAGVRTPEEFEDSLVVGDELTAQLEDYVERTGHALSNAVFLTCSGYSWVDVNDEPSGGPLSLILDNRQVSLIEAILRTGAKKLYIQLGMHDIREWDEYYAKDFAQIVLSSILTSQPDLQIIVMPITPLIGTIEYDGLSNTSIATYNLYLRAFCDGNPNCTYLDLDQLCPDGSLPMEYCADPESTCILWNDTACALWASVIDGSYAVEHPEESPEPEEDGGENAPANPGEEGGAGRGDVAEPPENSGASAEE